MRYLDFDIEVGAGLGRSYPLVVRSAAGDTRLTMQFPYDELELKDKLKDLRIALLQSSQTHRALTDEEQAVQDFGQRLFETLFTGVAGSLFYESRIKAAQEGLLGVRLRLNVRAPELAGLPWEYLYDPRAGEYLCLSRSTPVVRSPELAQPIQPLLVTPPLRILGMIASPGDQDPLDITREKTRMDEALKTLQSRGVVELVWLEGQTWEDLQEAMWPSRGPWHIFHFIGHGGYDKRSEEGVLALCDEEGQTQLLLAHALARLLTNHNALRLVVMNACEGAKGGARDLFSSTAATLARRGIPAVLAMQENITDKAAIQLTRTFYRALANGLPMDVAVAEARTAISVSQRYSLEWGTPVLFLRAPDSTLFTLNSSKPALTPVPMPVMPPTPAPMEPAAPAISVEQPETPVQSPVAPGQELLPLTKTKVQWVEEGEQHSAAGRFVEALDCYEQALAQDGHFLLAMRGRALALNGLNHPTDALAAVTEALQIAPQDAVAHYTRGLILAGMGRYGEAVSAFDDAIKLHPQYGAAHAAKMQALANLGKPAQVAAALGQALALVPTDSVVRQALKELNQRLPVGTLLLNLTGHTSIVRAVAWSPDGSRLASASSDKTARLWDASSGQALITLNHDTSHLRSSQVLSVAWSPDGSRLASACYDKSGGHIWDASSGKSLAFLTNASSMNAVAWSPDGTRIASASEDQRVTLYGATRGQPLAILAGHTGSVNAVAWSTDGRRLASASEDQTVRLWDTGSGNALATLKGHTSNVRAVAWSPDGRRLASAGDDRTMRLWDAESGQTLTTLTGHTVYVYSVAWSPDGRRLASAGMDGTVRLWDAESGQTLTTLTGHTRIVCSVAWSPDGRRLASAGDDQTVRVWWVGEGQQQAQYPLPNQ